MPLVAASWGVADLPFSQQVITAHGATVLDRFRPDHVSALDCGLVTGLENVAAYGPRFNGTNGSNGNMDDMGVRHATLRVD